MSAGPAEATPAATLAERLATVRAAIEAAAARVGRDTSSIRLIAVSKLQPASAIHEALVAGQIDFGENYPQELVAKAQTLEGVAWHFIGTLQASGAAKVAAHADWVHGLVPGRAAERLLERAVADGRIIEGLIQVDLADRPGGLAPDQLARFADQLAHSQGVRLRGLMTLPPAEAAGEAARPYFQRLADLHSSLIQTHPEARELSMGMSLDYEIAVEEGATMVRVGTAVFGERPAKRPTVQ